MSGIGSEPQSTGFRPPAVAGRFYPESPDELRQVIERLLSQVRPIDAASPKAIIAPHAAYPYSGPVAASAYAQLGSERGLIKRVILLGPSHYVSFRGLAVSGTAGFATPLGIVPVDTEAVQMLLSLPQIVRLDEAHAREHSLEVHLPFLQVVLGAFQIVPLVAGEAGSEEVVEVLDRLWGGPETRFLISSDLSHYREYRKAQQMDRTTAGSLERLCPEEIGQHQACGDVPVRGLLAAARFHRLSCRTLDLRNSGDTGGPRDRVVGYGAFAFTENALQP